MMMKQQASMSTFKNLVPVDIKQSDNISQDSAISDPDEPNQHMVGRLTFEQRKQKVDRYLQKKRRRSKVVRYECRKKLAQKRLRYQGRFISEGEAEKLDKFLVYNPNDNLVPKPIFRTFKDTTRWKRRCGNKRLLDSIDSDESKNSCYSDLDNSKKALMPGLSQDIQSP